MSKPKIEPLDTRQKPLYTTWLPLWLMAIGCYLSGFLSERTTGTVAQWAPLALAVFGSIVLYWWASHKLTPQRIIFLLFAAGFVLRIFYVLYTGYSVRQHDVWRVDSGKGHMEYIQYIAENLALPNTNEIWQFYHPPLHHILAGVLYRMLANGGMEPLLIAEKMQLLTAFYSCAVMVVCDRLFAAFGLSDRARALANAVVVFHPSFILLGGSLNNDMLYVLMACLSLLYFVKWWREEKIGQLALCGLFLGLCMMAKTSGAMLAFPYAAAFLWKLIEQRKQPWPLIRQYVAFGCISVPVGMWYPIRNLLLFGQSFTYVPALGTGSNQYIGNFSAAQRLFSLPAEQLRTPYQSFSQGVEHYKEGYNIPLSMFKTSLFGEADMGGGIWAYLLLVAAVVLAVLAAVYMLWHLDRDSLKEDGLHLVFSVMWLSMVFSYVLFCFSYPHVCSEDFRYLVPILPIAALYLGRFVDRRRTAWARGVGIGLIGVFCACSTLVYAFPMVW